MSQEDDYLESLMDYILSDYHTMLAEEDLQDKPELRVVHFHNWISTIRRNPHPEIFADVDRRLISWLESEKTQAYKSFLMDSVNLN